MRRVFRREAKNLRNPQPPTTTSIANGKKLAEANCVSCHGPKGKGDGPAAASAAAEAGRLDVT
jgi:mono/diheme cytochrome c family protein